MMLTRCLIVGFVSLSAASCGLLNKDSDEVGDASAGPENKQVFALTGSESSEIKADEVSNFVNSSPEFLVKPSKPFLLSKDLLIGEISGFSRDRNEEKLADCAAKKLANIPLQVTKDTVSYSIEIDLTKECDREVRDDDKVGFVKNTIRVSASLGCAGNANQKLVGQTLESVTADNVCIVVEDQKISSKKMAYEYTIDSRKVTRAKNGTEYEDVRSDVNFKNVSIKSKSGLPCNFVTNNVTGTTTFDSCRWVSQERKIGNEPKYENNSPNDKTDPHPKVNQKVVTVNNATLEKGADYYTTADSSFMYNGWEGKLTFVHGWAKPTWEATYNNTKRGGVFDSPINPTAADTKSN